MTATLPSLVELEFRQTLHLTQPYVLRASSDRPNLRYCVQSLTPGDEGVPKTRSLLTATVETCQREMVAWSTGAVETGTAVTARGICYVRNKALGQELADRLRAVLYHGGLSHEDRTASIPARSEGRSSLFIVATSSLSAGLHYSSVRLILHVNAPDGLLNCRQETARAGQDERDGLSAVCLTLLTDNWTVNWDIKFKSDLLHDDTQRMTQFLQSRSCLRQCLTSSYLDGDAEVACKTPSSTSSPRKECSMCSSTSVISFN